MKTCPRPVLPLGCCMATALLPRDHLPSLLSDPLVISSSVRLIQVVGRCLSRVRVVGLGEEVLDAQEDLLDVD